MKLNERQQQILELVDQKQRVSVAFLAKRLYVSEMTVRRDLIKLEQESLLRRYHGGALAIHDYLEYPIQLRAHINEKEKRDLAKQAEQFLRDGQTIFLPSSSTCSFLIPLLKQFKGIRVITNSVQFAISLARMQISCILTGGEYRENSRSLVGRVAEATLRSMNTDIAILTCDGISDDGMVTVEEESGAELVRIGFQNTQKRVILIDRSKMGMRYTYNVCHRDEVDHILIL